MDKCILTESV